MSFLNDSFYFGFPFNFISDSPFIAKAENIITFPPVSENFRLLDGTLFLLLDGTHFLLL